MSTVPDTAAIPLELQPHDSSYPVWSISASPVPHGLLVGFPAVVLKLQGCPVGCPWCDQPPASLVEPFISEESEQATEEDLERGCSGRFRWVSTTRLVALIGAHGIGHVLITGGEPALFDLSDLTEALEAAGLTVQVETSGIAPLSVSRNAWVTLSPQAANMDMPTRPWIYRRANEIIHLVTGPEVRKQIEKTLRHFNPSTPVFLKPLAGRPDLDELAWRLAVDHRLRLLSAPTLPLLGSA